MRKNCARKWLHFILDLLPLVVIPIFAINIINRSPEPISVVVDDTETTYSAEVQYQYKYQTNEVNDWSDLVVGNVYSIHEYIGFSSISSSYYFDITILNGDLYVDFVDYTLNFSPSHVYSIYDGIRLQTNNNTRNLTLTYGNFTYIANDSDINEVTLSGFDFIINSNVNGFVRFLQDYWDDTPEVVEPSTFNIIESASATLVETTTGSTTTYNDTDIGSQFLYTLYNAVDKYFNFDNVFNFGQLKTWLGTNLFGGSMPMVAVIVYNIIVYELLMDLMFLIYGVFMFIIDCGTDLLEKPFNKMRGR